MKDATRQIRHRNVQSSWQRDEEDVNKMARYVSGSGSKYQGDADWDDKTKRNIWEYFFFLFVVASVYVFTKESLASSALSNSRQATATKLVYNDGMSTVENKGKSQEQLFVRKWIQHMDSHPIQPSDRTGFAEMALRTRAYNRLLEAQITSLADELETKIWPFVTKAKQLRRAAFGVQDEDPDLLSLVEESSSSEQEQDKELNDDPSVASSENETVDLKLSTVASSRTASQASKVEWQQPTETQQQRGIVMSLGRSEFRFAMHFISMLRNVHKSKLPVELYYYGDDDLPQFMREHIVKSFDKVRTIDIEALDIFDADLTSLFRQGWALKPFTLLATNLTEVMLVDADVVLLTRPDDFFQVQGYKETGTLFFHDRDHFRQGASDVVFDFMEQQLGMRGPSAELASRKFWTKKLIYEQESGVVVVNKSKATVFSALFFAAWQNTGNVRERTTYRVFWGDKESYWLAFELAGFPYYFVEHYAGGIGNDPRKGEFCADHPLHFLPADKEEDLSWSREREDGDSSEQKEAKGASHSNKKGPGRPAWFNGSLLENKGRNETVYLQSSSWAVDGDWIFYEEEEKWCMPNMNYQGSLSDFGLSSLLPKMIKSAQAADKMFSALSKI